MPKTLTDLNKGVVSRIMNVPLSAADPLAVVQPPQNPPAVSTEPKTLDPAPPSERVAPVPKPDEFPPANPNSLVDAFTTLPEEKKPVTGIPPDQLPPPGTSDKDMNFQKLRTKLESTTAELVELKSKYFDVDGKQLKPEFVQSKEEIENLKKELQTTQDRLARYNLMEDPRFVKKYNTKIGKIESEAKRVLKDFGVDETILKELRGLNLKERHQVIVDKAPDTQHMLEPLLTQLDQIRSEQQAEMDDWKNTVQKLDTERTGETEMKIRQMKEAFHASTVRQLEEEGHPFLKVVPGNERWNQGVQTLKNDMRQMLEVNDPKLQTRALFASLFVPIYQAKWMQAEARIKDLEGQLQTLGGVRPTVGSRGAGDSSSAPSGQKPTSVATPQNVARDNARRFFG